MGTVANSCSTMHKIAAKEFSQEDFSREHLFGPDDMLKWDERKDIARDNALAAVNVDGNWCYFTPQGYIQMTCNILNHYREKYLETQDKRYWWQMIQLLPSSYNQRRTVMLNYEVLANIYAIIDEACDVLTTVFIMLYQYGVTEWTIQQNILAKCKRALERYEKFGEL